MLTAFTGAVRVTGAVLGEGTFGDDRPGSLAGPMGLLVILLLAAITIFLMRSMNARLRRLPDRFPDPSDTPAPPPGEDEAAPRAAPPHTAHRDDST